MPRSRITTRGVLSVTWSNYFGGGRQPDGQGFAAFGEVVHGFDALDKIFAKAEPAEVLSQQISIHDVSVDKDFHGIPAQRTD